MKMTKSWVKAYLAAENGAVAIEYAIIAVALTLAIIGGFPSLTAAITTRLQGIVTSFGSLG